MLVDAFKEDSLKSWVCVGSGETFTKVRDKLTMERETRGMIADQKVEICFEVSAGRTQGTGGGLSAMKYSTDW